MDYLTAQGLSHIQAAAIIGAFTVESNLNPYAVGDKNLKVRAHGIGQWRGDRWSNLQTLAKTRGKSPFDLLLQLEYALVELGTTERFAGEKLFGANTIEALRKFVGVIALRYNLLQFLLRGHFLLACEERW